MTEQLPPLFREINSARRAGHALKDVETKLWKKYGTTCAMLVLDSTGFTRATQARGIVSFLDTFLHMRELVGPAFESHRSLAWRSAADNLFAEFTGPDAALEAAMAAHHAVAEAGLVLGPGEPYRVCIGIGYGRVLAAGQKGVYGNEMNLVCKLGEDLAEGGETLLTVAAYQRLKRRKSFVFERRESIVSGTSIAYYAARR